MRTLLVTAFITLVAATANAQVLGYGVAGPAGARGFANTRAVTFNAAAGGEILLAKYFAVGGEAGFFDRLITLSTNGSLHVVSAGIRFELRDHIRPDHRGTTHYGAFRVGVVLR